MGGEGAEHDLHLESVWLGLGPVTPPLAASKLSHLQPFSFLLDVLACRMPINVLFVAFVPASRMVLPVVAAVLPRCMPVNGAELAPLESYSLCRLL